MPLISALTCLFDVETSNINAPNMSLDKKQQ